MKLLVTGANGFLGQHVVTSALQAGHSVRALVRPAVDIQQLSFSEHVEFFRADLRSVKNLTDAFDDIDALVHLAAGVTGDEYDQFVAAVVTTENLLRAMAQSATKRIVLISSFSVYCYDRIHRRLDEQSPTNSVKDNLYDRDGYAIAKTWQERVTREQAILHNWELCVIRPGFIYGPGNDDLAGLGIPLGPSFLRVAGGKRLPLTYVENTAEAIVRAVESDAAVGQTLNLIDSDGESPARYARELFQWQKKRRWMIPLPYWLGLWNAKLARFLSKLLFRGKGKLPGILVPSRFAARFKPLRFPNNCIRKVLNWQPKISFDEALKRTFPSDRKS
jgi:nucleoside-diphosphate-sugar epimerase